MNESGLEYGGYCDGEAAGVTVPGSLPICNPQSAIRNHLVLSLFPGIDLLGRAFAAAGFCVVAGPDLVTGGDVRQFRGVPRKFDGIIGGPPCQGFSTMNVHRHDPTHPSVVTSRAMLREFTRIVTECEPTWWLCENVPAVPDVRIEGYTVQRLAISDQECGGVQVRMRHIQYGHRDCFAIRPERVTRRPRNGRKPQSITTKINSRWSSYAEQCRRQGFEPISLPGWTKEAKFRAVGNGVPLTIGRALAAAVAASGPRDDRDCPCGCGRVLAGKQLAATASCRKRLQRERDGARPWVDVDGYHDGVIHRS